MYWIEYWIESISWTRIREILQQYWQTIANLLQSLSDQPATSAIEIIAELPPTHDVMAEVRKEQFLFQELDMEYLCETDGTPGTDYDSASIPALLQKMETG